MTAKKWQQRQVTKKFFFRKASACRDGTLNRWEWHHNTFTPFLHHVPFCQLFGMFLFTVCMGFTTFWCFPLEILHCGFREGFI